MPVVLVRIIDITRNPDSDPHRLAEAVMSDQSLTSRVLRLANSAYFRRRQQVETVSEAILTLGFNYVRNLAASATVIDALFPRKAFAGFDWQSMWTHSVTVAIAAETISTFKSGTQRRGDEAAFVAGLLHDIGKLLVAYTLPIKFLSIIEACHKTGKDMVELEKDFIGTNHAYLGLQLGEEWGLPESLVQGIGWHHAPECAFEYADLAKAVHAGNLLANRLGGSSIRGVKFSISIRDIASAAEIDTEDVDFIVNAVRDGLKRSAELLSWGSRLPSNH